MSYSVKPSEVKTLMPGDGGFKFTSNLVEYPRAAIVITEDCPDNLKSQIWIYQRKGYIKPVAYVPTKELVWEELVK
jgi:hypothetical protein